MTSLSNVQQGYARQKYGIDTGPDFSHFEMQNYAGPRTTASLQAGNRSSNQWSFETKDFGGGKPLSISSDTSGSLFGAGIQAGMGGA